MKYLYYLDRIFSVVLPDGTKVENIKSYGNMILDHRLTQKDLDKDKMDICNDFAHEFMKNHRTFSFFTRKKENATEVTKFIYTQIRLLAELPEEQTTATDNR